MLLVVEEHELADTIQFAGNTQLVANLNHVLDLRPLGEGGLHGLGGDDDADGVVRVSDVGVLGRAVDSLVKTLDGLAALEQEDGVVKNYEGTVPYQFLLILLRKGLYLCFYANASSEINVLRCCKLFTHF